MPRRTIRVQPFFMDVWYRTGGALFTTCRVASLRGEITIDQCVASSALRRKCCMETSTPVSTPISTSTPKTISFKSFFFNIEG